MKTIPKEINGNRCIEYKVLPEKQYPEGYSTSQDGIDKMEPIDTAIICVSEGVDNEDIFFLNCINDKGEVQTGDMSYTIEDIRNVFLKEYGLISVEWNKI